MTDVRKMLCVQNNSYPEKMIRLVLATLINLTKDGVGHADVDSARLKLLVWDFLPVINKIGRRP